MTNRTDAWKPEHDLLLAEVVIKHIENGSTQLNGFEEAGDRLNRTASACGFRWNKEIRHIYEEQIEDAKRRRKVFLRSQSPETQQTHKKMFAPTEPIVPTIKPALDSPIQAAMDSFSSYITNLTQENDALIEENEALRKENAELRRDYGEFVSLMNRAKDLALQDIGATPAPKFKMAQNGNLESLR